MLMMLSFMESESAVYAMRHIDDFSVEIHMRHKRPWSLSHARELRKDFNEVRANLRARGYRRLATSAPLAMGDMSRWWKFIGFPKEKIQAMRIAVGDL